MNFHGKFIDFNRVAIETPTIMSELVSPFVKQ